MQIGEQPGTECKSHGSPGINRMRFDAPLQVGFVALGAYPLFDPAVRGPMGGMESRAWLFAREFATRAGTKVSFVVDDHGQLPVQEFGRITCFARRNSLFTALTWVARGIRRDRNSLRRSGITGLRRGYLSLLWRAPVRFARAGVRVAKQSLRGIKAGFGLYSSIPADVILTFGVNEISAEVIAACRTLGRKSILCLAHDADLDDAFVGPVRTHRADGVSGVSGHYALTYADEIVVQSQAQQRLLRERFGREGCLVMNPIDLTRDDTDGRPPEPVVQATIVRGPFVLWVGRSDPNYKRPDLCFELARRLAHIRFVVVMGQANAQYHAELKSRKPQNVDLIEGLPFHAMPHLFRASLALVSTSAQEGFPNTFLQAGKYHVPVVSLNVDPDGMFGVQKAGIVCQGDLDRMAGAVGELAANPGRRRESAERLADYVARVHGLEACCDALGDVIHQAARRDERGARRTGVRIRRTAFAATT